MRRREFIALFSGAAAAWPRAARAQQPAMPVIGMLRWGTPATAADELPVFLKGLSDAGYVEGQNVTIEYRWSGSQNDLLPVLAEELVRRRVNVLVTQTTPAALAAKAATVTIPILFSVGADPVKLGLVRSYNQPGGNITGISALNNVLASKQLEVLHELVPKAAKIAILVNPDHPNAGSDVSDAQLTAQSFGVRLETLRARDERDLEEAFAIVDRQRVEGLLISPTFGDSPNRVIALAERHAVPAIYPWREHAFAGGLLSYGSDRTEASRQLGLYTGRILKGASPANLPVWEAVKIELILNLKTARALGLTVPPTLLARADEVIE
jgi:putative tryptophan/tyrosine transport system substrate-binding protein